jgi:hypothetical protein
MAEELIRRAVKAVNGSTVVLPQCLGELSRKTYSHIISWQNISESAAVHNVSGLGTASALAVENTTDIIP